MPKSTATCDDIVGLYYNATPIANIADDASASPLANIYVALHTASLTPAATQSTSETAYTNYARVAVARTTGGWSAPASGATSNVAAIEFAQCGVTGATITTASTGKASSGATDIFHYGDLNASITVSNAIQPRFPAAAATITEA